MSRRRGLALFLSMSITASMPSLVQAEVFSYAVASASGFTFTGSNHRAADWLYDSWDELGRYQTFMLPEDRTVSHITVMVRAVSGNAPKFSMAIVPWVSGAPSGSATPITGEYVPSNPPITGSWTPIMFSFNTPLKAGEYAVILRGGDPSAPTEWLAGPGYVSRHWGKYAYYWDRANHVDKSRWVEETGTAGTMGWMRVNTLGRNGELIDLSHNGVSGVDVRPGQLKFQTFVTTEASTRILGVDLKLSSLAWNGGELAVELYATSGNLPAGDPLASATVPFAEFAGGATGQYEIIHAPVRCNGLKPNAVYAIVLRTRDRIPSGVFAKDRQNAWRWATAAVHNGLSSGAWNGQAWVTDASGNDAWMQVWAESAGRVLDYRSASSAGLGFGFTSAQDEERRYQIIDLTGLRGRSITGIDLKVRTFGVDYSTKNYSYQAHPSDIVVELYNAAGGFPVGAALASASIPFYFVGPAWTIVHAPLWLPSVTADSYAIVLRQVTPQASRYEWAIGRPSVPFGPFGKFSYNAWKVEPVSAAGWLVVWTDEGQVVNELIPKTTGTVEFASPTNSMAFQGIAPSYMRGLEVNIARNAGTDDAAMPDMEWPADVLLRVFPTSQGVPTGSGITVGVIPAYLVPKTLAVMRVLADFQMYYPNQQMAVVLDARRRKGAYTYYRWNAAPPYNFNKNAGVLGHWDGQKWVTDTTSIGRAYMRTWLVPPVVN